MGISDTGSMPDLFPHKQAYVVQDEVRSSFFASHCVNTELHLFHPLVSACAEFKVTHHEDRFMAV